MALLLDAGVAPDTGTPAADASPGGGYGPGSDAGDAAREAQGSSPLDFLNGDGSKPPNMPDWAQWMPWDVQDATQNQQVADQWRQQQLDTIADVWRQLALQQGQLTLHQAISDAQQAQASGPDLGPGSAAGDAARNAETPPTQQPQGPNVQDLLTAMHGFFSRGVPAVGQGLMGDVTGLQPNAPVGPGNEGVGATAPAAQATVQNAPGAVLNAATNPLSAGVDVVNQVNAANGTGQPPVPTPEQAAQQGIISPAEATAATTMGGVAAGGPEAAAAPVALGKDIVTAGAARVADAIAAPAMERALGELTPTAAQSGRAMAEGVPYVMGGASQDDLLPIARESLTADHPIVQAVAKASAEAGAEVDPQTVANLIQSKGFNPANMAKNPARLSPVQTAALTAYKVSQDAELANGLVQAAAQATGKEAAAVTADDVWQHAPGIGMNAAAPTEPGADIWNSVPGLSGQPNAVADLSPSEREAVYRTQLRQTRGPMNPTEAAAPGTEEGQNLLNAEGRTASAPIDPEGQAAAIERYNEALQQWRQTGEMPPGYTLNGDMNSPRGLRATDPEEQALLEAPRPSTGSLTLDQAKANLVQRPPTFGDILSGVERGLVRAKMMNPLIHIPNMLSETAGQFGVRPIAGLRALQQADALIRDPEALGQLLNENPGLHLAGTSQAANDLTHTVTGAIDNVPVAGGLKQAVKAVSDASDNLTFGVVGKRLQLASYLDALERTGDPQVAAEYANAKFGAIPDSERSTAMQWISQHMAFAGRWLQGTGIQLGSVVGKPTFGGYAADLTDAQQAQLAGMLRGDFMRGIGMLAGSHIAINYALSGHGPWHNEPGRWLDIDTGHQDAQGKEIYLADPFFRRVQDAVHLLAIPIPGNPLTRGMATTTTDTLLNKVAPLPAAAIDVVSGNQYLSPSDQPPGITGGPPIIAAGSDLTDALKQAGAFVVNQVSPVELTSTAATRSPEGIKLTQPQVRISAGPGETSPLPGPAQALGDLTGVRPVAGGRDIGTTQEYFANQEDQAYGAAAQPFHAAGVQLTTMPNTFTVGTGKNQVSVPTTTADKSVFQQAYKQVLDEGVAKYPNATKAVLTQIEQKAFTAGKDAVLKTLTKDEVTRRVGVASGGPSSATAFWKGAAPAATPSSAPTPSARPSAPAATTPAGGTATAFWKKSAA